MLNTNKKGGVTISDFTDAAGGGTLESTGGEILTMMLTSIEDDNIYSQQDAEGFIKLNALRLRNLAKK